MAQSRTELQNEVVEALVSSKAIDFNAVGSVLSKFGARAVVSGDTLGVILNRRVMDICIPPEPYTVLQGIHEHNIGGGQTELR